MARKYSNAAKLSGIMYGYYRGWLTTTHLTSTTTAGLSPTAIVRAAVIALCTRDTLKI